MSVETAVDNVTITRVASSATTVTLAARQTGRRSLVIFNESTAVLYVKFGATASNVSYSFQIAAGGYWESSLPCWRGVVDGIWTAANGAAQITEGY